MNKELTFEEAIEQIKGESERTREAVEVAEQLAEIIHAITKVRIDRGLTQRQLAEMSGIKQSAIARMESVQAVPRLDTLVRICRCLGIKLKVEGDEIPKASVTTIIMFPNTPNHDYGWNTNSVFQAGLFKTAYGGA